MRFVSSVGLISLFVLFIPTLSAAVSWNVPADAPTIQAGIDSASVGDTVLVSCDTYTISQALTMKSGVVLRSETGDPDCVILDADTGSAVIILDYTNSATFVEGFTLTGSGVTAVYCRACSATVEACVITGNAKAGDGGGAWGWGPARFIGCSFSNNAASTVDPALPIRPGMRMGLVRSGPRVEPVCEA